MTDRHHWNAQNEPFISNPMLYELFHVIVADFVEK